MAIAMATQTSPKTRFSGQLATFHVADRFFGVDVLCVQEVLRYHQMTRVPGAPEVIEGLINLRGQIVTAVDMRRRLKLKPRPEGQTPMNTVVRTAEGAARGEPFQQPGRERGIGFSRRLKERRDARSVVPAAFAPVQPACGQQQRVHARHHPLTLPPYVLPGLPRSPGSKSGVASGERSKIDSTSRTVSSVCSTSFTRLSRCSLICCGSCIVTD